MNIIETNLEFNGLTKRDKTNRGIFHNSGVTVLQSVETIHNCHKNTNKWAGIGYHFYIRKDGKIYRGRPIETIGAHAYGSNSDSIGICFEGNFNVEQMTNEQIESGKWIVSYIKGIYPNITFCGHRDVCNTSCPGANFKFDEIVKGQASKPIVKPQPSREFEKKDPRIGEYQRLLNEIYIAGLNVDNWWGEKTAKATRKYVALKNGSTGKLVRWYQARLKEQGYNLGNTGNAGIDGDFRKICENATKDFQRKHGLTVDGVVGIQVIRKLIELM